MSEPSDLPDDPRALLPLVYDELDAIARRMHRQHRAASVRPSSILQDAWTRIAKAQGPWESRAHFMGLAASAMRQALIDRARKRLADKRGAGWARVTLSGLGDGATGAEVDIIDVERALSELEASDPRAARIVELRCLGGLEHGEIAELLEASERTIQREWRAARAWMILRLER